MEARTSIATLQHIFRRLECSRDNAMCGTQSLWQITAFNLTLPLEIRDKQGARAAREEDFSVGSV